MNNQTSTLLQGILVRWRLRDPGVLWEISVDVMVGLVKTRFLSPLSPWCLSVAHTVHEHTDIIIVSTCVTVLIALYMCQCCCRYRQLPSTLKDPYFSVPVTLSLLFSKRDLSYITEEWNVVYLYIYQSITVKNESLSTDAVQNVINHCYLSAALMVM